MLQNAYFLAKIGADTAENEQHFAESAAHLPDEGARAGRPRELLPYDAGAGGRPRRPTRFLEAFPSFGARLPGSKAAQRGAGSLRGSSTRRNVSLAAIAATALHSRASQAHRF